MQMEDSATPSVLILGASTRAAAYSAIRAGLQPICADLFADLDLRANAHVLDVADYPRGLIAAAAAAPRCPWMYTGGLENHPNLVARISQTRPLWGNGPDLLRRIRDPWYVRRLLEGAGLPALGIWPQKAAPPPADGGWMLKPLRGAAGRGIRVWDRTAAGRGALQEPGYLQERRRGTPFSALFLAARECTFLLGITRQLVGLEEAHAPPYAWCGTITPVELPDKTTATIRQIGECLGRVAGLTGLFGCDLLIEQGEPWLTEVNPRYPASTELIECWLGANLLYWHRQAYEGSFAEPPSAGIGNHGQVFGKIVMYSGQERVAPDLTRFVYSPSNRRACGEVSNRSLPYIADIPLQGTKIARGQPTCTLFARAKSEAECFAKLVRRARRFDSMIR
jgi:predicted ATP-grasp superfamily ATP-dependent carboligase